MKKSIIYILFLIPVLLVGQNKPNNNYFLYLKMRVPIEKAKKSISVLKKEHAFSFKKQKSLSKTLNGYLYKTTLPLNKTSAKRLVKLLKKIDNVIYCNLMPSKPIKPPYDILPVTSDFASNQTYLDKNPGVNATYAWSKGATGTGIKVRVIEYGINPNHEEFNDSNIKITDGFTLHNDVSDAYVEHGVATSGVVFADNGAYGVTGIAYGAFEYILYPEWTLENDYDRVLAVTTALENSTEGDVVIFEIQAYDADNNLVPAEYDSVIWDLTKAATDRGVIIIAAAGNGSQNLDDPIFSEYIGRGNSGAIIVGAGTPDVNHNRIESSTYGNRVDVQAWGSDVFTTGYGNFGLNVENQNYTAIFAGTSSATAMTSACVIVLQSYYHNLTGNYLSPIEMRNLLIDTGISPNTAQHIGPFINLKSAIDNIDETLLSVQHVNNSFYINVFPNPVNNILNIRQINTTSKRIDVFNVLGKKIITTYISKKDNYLNLKKLKRGVYFIKISFKNKAVIKKIIKK